MNCEYHACLTSLLNFSFEALPVSSTISPATASTVDLRSRLKPHVGQMSVFRVGQICLQRGHLLAVFSFSVGSLRVFLSASDLSVLTPLWYSSSQSSLKRNQLP